MRRIVLDLQGGLLAEAVMQVLAGYDPDFIVYRSSKPGGYALRFAEAARPMCW